jgi:hypothetical protein
MMRAPARVLQRKDLRHYGVTVIVNVVELVKPYCDPPETSFPVTVTVCVPAGVPVVVNAVSRAVDVGMVCETAMSYRDKLKVGPLLTEGETLVTPTLTVPANPCVLVTVRVNLWDEPAWIVALAGETLSVKPVFVAASAGAPATTLQPTKSATAKPKMRRWNGIASLMCRGFMGSSSRVNRNLLGNVISTIRAGVPIKRAEQTVASWTGSVTALRVPG